MGRESRGVVVVSNRNPFVVLGIDLAGSPRRPTGLCLLRGLRAQTKRSIDGNEVRLGLLYGVQDVVIAERDVRLSPQATKEAHTCRTARRTREVDP